MNTLDAGPSDNHRGSETWFRSWTQLRVDRRSPGYCRTTFDNRTIIDHRLEDEVDAIAARLARVNHDAIARTKSHVDRWTLEG